MAKCTRCGARHKRVLTQTHHIQTAEDDPYKDKKARVFFRRVFNLTLNQVNRQFAVGEQVSVDYPTLYLIIRMLPTNVPFGFVVSEEEKEFNAIYSI